MFVGMVDEGLLVFCEGRVWMVEIGAGRQVWMRSA